MQTYKVFIMDRTAKNPSKIKTLKAANIDNLRKRILADVKDKNLSIDIGVIRSSVGMSTKYIGTLETTYVNNRPSWKPAGKMYWERVDPKTGRLM